MILIRRIVHRSGRDAQELNSRCSCSRYLTWSYGLTGVWCAMQTSSCRVPLWGLDMACPARHYSSPCALDSSPAVRANPTKGDASGGLGARLKMYGCWTWGSYRALVRRLTSAATRGRSAKQLLVSHAWQPLKLGLDPSSIVRINLPRCPTNVLFCSVSCGPG